jgi:hypothetical protein
MLNPEAKDDKPANDPAMFKPLSSNSHISALLRGANYFFKLNIHFLRFYAMTDKESTKKEVTKRLPDESHCV